MDFFISDSIFEISSLLSFIVFLLSSIVFCKSFISDFKSTTLYCSDFRPLDQLLFISFTIVSLSSITSKPINLDSILPFSVGFVCIMSSRLSASAIIVNKKSSTEPIDFFMNSSVSRLCSPSRFSIVLSGSIL